MTKRRILATVMVLALCLGLLSVTALGEEPSPGSTDITRDITKATFTVNTDDATYTGEPITKDIHGVYKTEVDTIDLVKDRDYTVDYEDNIDEGKATIIITGIDPYIGTLTYHFNIIKSGESPNPSESPSTNPSESPSTNPSESPSTNPSESPSTNPSESPSTNPSESPEPSASTEPSESPSTNPSESPEPSESPSTNPSENPSTEPSASPSTEPSATPSQKPDDDPNPTPAESKLTLNKSSVRVQTNQTVSVTATVSGPEDKNIYAISADTSVATVSVSDKTITVKGVAVGNTSVYVIMSDVNTVTLADAEADPGVQKLEVTVTGPSASSGINYRPSYSGGGGGGGGGNDDNAATTTPPPTQTATPASELFADVAKGSWYEPGVTYVVSNGLFKGMSEGIFSPHTNMTRAMVMTVLARMDGQDTTNAVDGPWYVNIMNWAMAKGITDGTMPDSSVTREQLVTLLYRYAKINGTAGDLTGFMDGVYVSPYARAAMTWAIEKGIITGKEGARLDPQGTATRAEVAAIIQRFVEVQE